MFIVCIKKSIKWSLLDIQNIVKYGILICELNKRYETYWKVMYFIRDYGGL